MSELLRITAGKAAGVEIELGDELLIGRAAAGEGSLGGDEELSREHARITRATGGLTIADLGSTNGTFVNGSQISEPTPIRNGDTISVGASTLEVVGTVPPDQATAERAVGTPVQPTHVKTTPPAAGPPPPGAPPPPPAAAPPAPGAAPPGPPPPPPAAPPGAPPAPPATPPAPRAGAPQPAAASQARGRVILAAVIAFLLGFGIATVIWVVL